MALSNYIVDSNPYNLPAPPGWWLQRLLEFDDSLVVLPSRQMNVYRLAQRRPPDPNIKLVGELMRDGGDTAMMIQHGLIPITTIVATCKWDNPLMWKDLAERAPWRQGGADAVIQHIEGIEAAKEQAIADQTGEQLDSLGKDGWNYYNMKRGLRTRMWSPKIKRSAPNTVQQESAAIRIK